ncbi:MAG: succinate dehydrogenase, cytochrome b556 subunit [Rickettsiales bacterium]|nr:succinate dehydrogenase, cytochrome b556 subunit [Rickettsiales bacterium]
MSDVKLKSRPISPHLTIYKPQITSILSISHRISGFFLYLGLLFLSWFIIFSNFQEFFISEYYISFFNFFFANILGKTALLFWVLAFYYHFCNGIRHLFWDIGKGYEIKSVKISGLIVIAASLLLSFASYYYGVIKLVQ